MEVVEVMTVIHKLIDFYDTYSQFGNNFIRYLFHSSSFTSVRVFSSRVWKTRRKIKLLPPKGIHRDSTPI